MKTFFAFLLGMFVMAGAAALYKEMPTIIKNWDNKPDVSVNDSTTEDSTTTTDDSTTTTTDESTTDDNATVQSNDESTYDDSTYDDSAYDDSGDTSFPDEITIPQNNSTDVELPPLPPLPINNELNALHNLRSICHQLQDIDRAVNEYPVLSPCP